MASGRLGSAAVVLAACAALVAVLGGIVLGGLTLGSVFRPRAQAPAPAPAAPAPHFLHGGGIVGAGTRKH